MAQFLESQPPDGSCVLSVEGEIDLAVVDEHIARMRACLARAEPLEVDFEGVTFIDSSGLGALVLVSKEAAEQGKDFALVNVHATALRLLQVEPAPRHAGQARHPSVGGTMSDSHEAQLPGPESREAAEALSRDTGLPARATRVRRGHLRPRSPPDRPGGLGGGARRPQPPRSRLLEVTDSSGRDRAVDGDHGHSATAGGDAGRPGLRGPVSRDAEMFSRVFGPEVGPEPAFVSRPFGIARRRASPGLQRSADTGAEPIGRRDPRLPGASPLHRGARHTAGRGRPRTRSGTPWPMPRPARIIFAERAIPADRRCPADRDSAFSDLHYAIYLGSATDIDGPRPPTFVDPSDLPLDGMTAETEIPFGDTVLTLVTSPADHLGSASEQVAAADVAARRSRC